MGNFREEKIKEVKLKISTNLDSYESGGPDGFTWTEDIEIIGNIFENS